jgi:hypothetical protein
MRARVRAPRMRPLSVRPAHFPQLTIRSPCFALCVCSSVCPPTMRLSVLRALALPLSRSRSLALRPRPCLRVARPAVPFICPLVPPAPPRRQLIGRANFSFFRFGRDPVLRERTIAPAEPYERGPKDVFMIHPGQVLYLQGYFDIPGRCQSRGNREGRGDSRRGRATGAAPAARTPAASAAHAQSSADRGRPLGGAVGLSVSISRTDRCVFSAPPPLGVSLCHCVPFSPRRCIFFPRPCLNNNYFSLRPRPSAPPRSLPADVYHCHMLEHEARKNNQTRTAAPRPAANYGAAGRVDAAARRLIHPPTVWLTPSASAAPPFRL